MFQRIAYVNNILPTRAKLRIGIFMSASYRVRSA